MQLYVTNAGVRVIWNRQGGDCFTLPELNALRDTIYACFGGIDISMGPIACDLPEFRSLSDDIPVSGQYDTCNPIWSDLDFVRYS